MRSRAAALQPAVSQWRRMSPPSGDERGAAATASIRLRRAHTIRMLVVDRCAARFCEAARKKKKRGARIPSLACLRAQTHNATHRKSRAKQSRAAPQRRKQARLTRGLYAPIVAATLRGAPRSHTRTAVPCFGCLALLDLPCYALPSPCPAWLACFVLCQLEPNAAPADSNKRPRRRVGGGAALPRQVK